MVRRIDAATWSLPASVGGFLMVCLMLVAATVRADEPPGQAELDKAIDAKLGADDLDDYDRVLEHCKKAVELGLDAGPHGHPPLDTDEGQAEAHLQPLACRGTHDDHGTARPPPTRPDAPTRFVAGRSARRGRTRRRDGVIAGGSGPAQ